MRLTFEGGPKDGDEGEEAGGDFEVWLVGAVMLERPAAIQSPDYPSGFYRLDPARSTREVGVFTWIPRPAPAGQTVTQAWLRGPRAPESA